ncbi:MAG: KEOPS complex subunit Pcc1 [Haloarculaceae archaeon]
MRRATVRTTHDDPAAIAASLRPDNTPEMDTRVDGDCVVTDLARETTGGLASTLDDYVVNLLVAEQCTTGIDDRTRDQDEDRTRDHDADRTRDQDTDDQTRDQDTDDQTRDYDDDNQ